MSSESLTYMVAEVPEMDEVCPEGTQNRKRPTLTSPKAVPGSRKGSGGCPQAVWPWPNCIPSLSFNSVKAEDKPRSLGLLSDIQPPIGNETPAQNQEGHLVMSEHPA